MQINIIGGEDIRICSFDVDEETKRHEPWTGNTQYYKQNLDKFLSGGKFYYPTYRTEEEAQEANAYYDYGQGFMQKYKNTKFIEELGEYNYSTSGDTNDDYDSSFLKEKKKRVIIYTEVEE